MDRGRRRRTIVLGSAIAVVLSALFFGLAVPLFVRSLSDLRPPRGDSDQTSPALQRREAPYAEAAARACMNALAAGEFSKAYSQTCGAMRSTWTVIEFEEENAARGQIGYFWVTGTVIRSREGALTGSVELNMTTAAGSVLPRQVAVIKENDEWRVCQ